MRNKHKNQNDRLIIMKAYDFMPKNKYAQTILHQRALQLAKKYENNHEDIKIIDYIKFKLGSNQSYGIPFSNIKEVISYIEITKIPFLPNYIDGVINHRGFLLSIINLNRYFKLNSTESNNKTNEIIIINDDNCKIGLCVDLVEGADSYELTKLDAGLNRNKAIKPEYIIGLHKGCTAVVNINSILTDISKQLNK